jgi:hypothetical protein
MESLEEQEGRTDMGTRRQWIAGVVVAAGLVAAWCPGVKAQGKPIKIG